MTSKYKSVRDKRYLDGICVRCPNKRKLISVLCQKCLDIHNESRRDKLKQRKENGLCSICGEKKEVGAHCLTCWFHKCRHKVKILHISIIDLQNLLESQN